MLAGLPQNPHYANPITNLERATQRQRIVLQRMVATGAITPEQMAQASETMSIPPRPSRNGGWFADWIFEDIPTAFPGSADLVLFLRNLHNWMAAGIAEKAFRDAFSALKPGGILGVEEHRDSPGAVQDALAPEGYVQQAYAIQLAKEAGFQLEASSEINANPKDDHDHPFGVWTLPPVARTSPRGQPADPTFDRSAYDAIGESDRMTLRFIKPG